MIVGVMSVDLAILDARTLKDKRRVIRSLTQRLRNGFNVSVSEVGYRDAPQRCRLGIAVVSSESRAVHSQLDKIVDMVRRNGHVALLEYEREVR